MTEVVDFNSEKLLVDVRLRNGHPVLTHVVRVSQLRQCVCITLNLEQEKHSLIFEG